MQKEIREGEPHEEIVALADEMGAGLIVIGHVGQRGPRRIFIGSVTELVIESATARCWWSGSEVRRLGVPAKARPPAPVPEGPAPPAARVSIEPLDHPLASRPRA